MLTTKLTIAALRNPFVLMVALLFSCDYRNLDPAMRFPTNLR